MVLSGNDPLPAGLLAGAKRVAPNGLILTRTGLELAPNEANSAPRPTLFPRVSEAK